MDRICMKTDSDISDICFPVSFQFPPPRMETDRIRIETDSDISDIHFSISLQFPSLFTPHIVREAFPFIAMSLNDTKSFQFPSLRMETDRICMETDSDISDIHFLISHPFPSLVGQVHNVSLCLRDHEHTTRAASQVFGSPHCFSVISHLHDVW